MSCSLSDCAQQNTSPMTASTAIDPSIVATGTSDGDAQNLGFMPYPFLRVVDGAKYSTTARAKGSRRGDF